MRPSTPHLSGNWSITATFARERSVHLDLAWTASQTALCPNNDGIGAVSYLPWVGAYFFALTLHATTELRIKPCSWFGEICWAG